MFSEISQNRNALRLPYEKGEYWVVSVGPMGGQLVQEGTFLGYTETDVSCGGWVFFETASYNGDAWVVQ
ncbi:hypothetical protein [Bacillus cereus]|uniref:hypothetical protein n=1 Tax=Bacillus cereus TaxID=1396 RepID=UPI001DBBBE39|nr:hypothetical protein [Bacillus cereus]MBG9613504.1 hypothetical protein [Bacillus cereus]